VRFKKTREEARGLSKPKNKRERREKKKTVALFFFLLFAKKENFCVVGLKAKRRRTKKTLPGSRNPVRRTKNLNF
jgi:hypothetical protein